MNPCLAKTWSDYIAKVTRRKAGFKDILPRYIL